MRNWFIYLSFLAWTFFEFSGPLWGLKGFFLHFLPYFWLFFKVSSILKEKVLWNFEKLTNAKNLTKKMKKSLIQLAFLSNFVKWKSDFWYPSSVTTLGGRCWRSRTRVYTAFLYLGSDPKDFALVSLNRNFRPVQAR